jgi:2-phosphosulfolactate phosphatase
MRGLWKRRLPDATASSAVGKPAQPATELAVDVAFTASRIPAGDVAVVVDVLRATSTIVQALAAGFGSVRCCRTLDAARSLDGPGRLLAAERDCRPPAGFALGNSPVEMASRLGGGDQLVLATTNGSPAIVSACRSVDRVLIASLLNLDATLAAIPTSGRLVIVCSGTEGAPALEDVYVAGRIIERLGGEHSDTARIAVCVAAAYGEARQALADSADAVQLIRTGQTHDIDWCARESMIDLVPEASPVGTETAVVSLSYT